MSFLVLHVPGGHFLPSSHDESARTHQPFVPGAAATERGHSAACSLSTKCMDTKCLELFRQVPRGRMEDRRLSLSKSDQSHTLTDYDSFNVRCIWKTFKSTGKMK